MPARSGAQGTPARTRQPAGYCDFERNQERRQYQTRFEFITEAADFCNFFRPHHASPSVMAAVEHAWKRKIRSRRFSRGWLLIFFGESKSSLRGPQDQTTSESKVRGQACRCQRLFAEKDSNRPNRCRSPQQLHRNENRCWMGRSQKVQTLRRSQELVRSENHY